MLISHSQDFLNGICTNIIHMHNRKLKYYTVSEWGQGVTSSTGLWEEETY